MPFLRFTKVIINYFLSQHKSLSKLQFQHYHTIKDDGIVSRLKFVRIREDYQEYGLPIPDMMLNDKIKQSESYQMFIKYFIGQIPPKRQRRVVKKKVTIVVDNIIPNPYVALELGKSISLTKAAEEEAARQVHATHPRIVAESVPEPARRRPSGISFRDTPRVSKKVSFDPSQKLKGVQSLTPEEQEDADTMQALKESRKTSKRQPGTRGLSEGTGRIPGIPDESTVISTTSSEGTGTKPGVPDEEKVTSEANFILKWGSKQESEYSKEDQSDDEEVDWIYSDKGDEKKDDADDDKSINLEMTDNEETEDEFVHGDEQVNDDEDEEMINAKVEESGNGDEENNDATKTDAEKTKEVKDDAKKAELPPTSSSLSVSLGFGDQFLKLLSDTDENPIRTLGDYSKPSHEGYRNTIELPVGNNVVPLRSDTIRLVQNGCSFHGIRSKDPNQHLKDFLKLVDSLDLDGSITTWEELTTRFLAQFFPPGKTEKLRNDILMFQQHHGESLSEAWTRFKDLLQKVHHHGIDLWLQNDPREFAKPVKAIALPQDVPSTSDRRLIELENQWSHDTQYCMENPEQAFVEYASSHTDEAGGKWYTFKLEQNNLGDTYNPSWKSHPNLRWRQPQNSLNNFLNPPNWFQPNGSILNRSFNNRLQNFNNQSNIEGLVFEFMAFEDAKLSNFKADFKQQQSEMTNKIDTVLKAITDQIVGTLPSDTVKNSKQGTSPVLTARSYPTEDPQCSTHIHSSINAITIYLKQPEES
ncbi:MAK10-like protein [Tanacetum coccineum]